MPAPVLISGSYTPEAPTPKRRTHLRGPAFRAGRMMVVFDYLPPMLLQSLDDWGKPTSPWVPYCGHCFRRMGDDPFDGHQGQLRPLTIENNRRCARCGRRCHPCDS